MPLGSIDWHGIAALVTALAALIHVLKKIKPRLKPRLNLQSNESTAFPGGCGNTHRSLFYTPLT